MKAISETTTTIDGDNITIIGKLIDVTFPAIVGRSQTIMHPVNGDGTKPRHVQVNPHGMVLKRHGSKGFLFPKDEIAAIASIVDSTLTDAPRFLKHPSVESLIGTSTSETPATIALEQSTDGKTWTKVENVPTGFLGTPKTHYRAIATNASGSTVSNPVLIK